MTEADEARLNTFLTAIFVGRTPNRHEIALAERSGNEAIADYIKSERVKIITRHKAVGTPDAGGVPLPPLPGLEQARELSDIIDAALARIYHLACEQAHCDADTLPIAIVATGGYGRQELSLFSDIDLTFIPQRDDDAQIDKVIRIMFAQAMDIFIARCGLELGYAYRLIEDCGNLDHQTACGLLDARLIVGNNRLFIKFEDAYWNHFNSADFIFAKIAELNKRLQKYGSTPRVVEPNLKEGPGGLRDLHTAIWLTQARRQLTASQMRGNRGLEMLARVSEVPASHIAQIQAAKEFLFRTRNALHALTGAERDHLVITRQEDVARLLGYVASCPEDTPPVERYMADLFPALATLRHTTDEVARRIGNSRLIMGLGLDSKRRKLVFADYSWENTDPLWLLWMFELVQKYDLEVSVRVERAARELAATNPALSDPKTAAQVFTTLLTRVGKVYPTLQKMADLEILGWFLPEFGRTMNLIPYDPSHDYTIGQHSLLIIKILEELLTAEDEERLEMRRILEEMQNPEELMLAILLHDSGKGIETRPHELVGEEIARAVCRRLNWSEEATSNVCFLISNHLVMAETSRLKDLNLDATITEFTTIVNDVDRLNKLYLLTYSDTSAVGAGVWTQVKGRFLRELWGRASSVLQDAEPGEFNEASLSRARNRLMKNLRLENLPEAEIAEHIQAMPANYLLNQDIKQMALHIDYVRRVRTNEIVIDFHAEPNASYTEVTVCTFDDPTPGLLAKIAGALAAAQLNVHSVQALTRKSEQDTIALDTVWVDYRGRHLSAGKSKEVRENLIATLSGQKTVVQLFSQSRSSLRKQDLTNQEITIANIVPAHSNPQGLAHIVLTAADVPITFYRFCDTFSRLGWDIFSAKISTFRNIAHAGFYVSGTEGMTVEAIRRSLHFSFQPE